MQTPATNPEHLTYGIQLWELGCLYYDGHNYRYSRTHRAVAPEHHGRIAVPVNHALKAHFAGPDELLAHITRAEGSTAPMPDQPLTLRALLPVGSTVYTVITHESRSGATCRLLFLACLAGSIVDTTAAIAAVLGIRTEHGQAFVIQPAATAGTDLTAQLARALHGSPAAIRHKQLG